MKLDLNITSERGDKDNWVKASLLQKGFQIISFEGYTIRNNHVSAVLERGAVDIHPSEVSPSDLESYLRSVPDFNLDAKRDVARSFKCPFFFLVFHKYLDRISNVVLYDITGGCLLLKTFDTVEDFGDWLMQYRDMKMLSGYEETELPQIDIVLRRHGTPWPGNLDGCYIKNGEIKSIIEFQRTKKLTVREHCNNMFFLPRNNRKGDVNRWKALDVIRKDAEVPLIIIVWSSKPQDREIKLKIVDYILYEKTENEAPGLRYSEKIIYDDISKLELRLNAL